MRKRTLQSPEAPAPASHYAQAVEISDYRRLVFVSGQIPVAPDGAVPPDFPSQCRLAWRNVEAQLRAGGMTLEHLVKVTIFLSDRRYAVENRTVRQEVLGERTPALTVIVCDIFDPAWLLEIEAIAAE
jgi:enamine deaminase RidA (YjgF/YER057c/UK114 family)